MMKNKTGRRSPSIGRRRTGAEFRALGWALRHPLTWLVPTVAVVAVALLGATLVTSIVVGVLLAALTWARAHPASWLTYAAPRLRSWRRRWSVYVGARWQRLTESCELVKLDRRTGAPMVPRLVRVSSPTPTIDRLTVRLPAGQAVRAWQDVTEELRDTLRVEAVAVTRARPGVVGLTVIRANPFTDPVPAVDIPASVGEVDLRQVEYGDTEYATAWTENLTGAHLLGAGATGSGKGSLIWNPLRGIGPLIREHRVRVWMVDPKGGTETSRARPLFHRWADHVDPDDNETDDGDTVYRGESAMDVIEAFRDDMRETQRAQSGDGVRKLAPNAVRNILVIDELAMITALSDRSTVRALTTWCAEIMTQGRATGHTLWAFVQEPDKDTVPLRDLFTTRICLRTNSANHVDMVLGEDARDRGALCDEIPAGEDHAGIGYRVDDRTRRPERVRAGLVTDDDIDELVRICTPYAETIEDTVIPGEGYTGHLIDFPTAS